MADRFAPEAKASLRRYSIVVRTDLTLPNATSEDEGRADLMCGIVDFLFYVEIKCGDTGYQTKGWPDDQRLWASRRHAEGGQVWYFVIVGKHRGNLKRKPSNYLPKQAFFVPYAAWKAAVEAVEALGLYTLPTMLKKGSRQVLQRENLDMQNLFAQYALRYLPDEDLWDFPSHHAFLHMLTQKGITLAASS